MTAHLAGSSVYVAVFLALGAVLGPEVLGRIHVPALALRLLWLLPLAMGFSALVVRWSSRACARSPLYPAGGR